MDIRICRKCNISSDINNFKKKPDGGICGRQCLKCVSKKNNERLKNLESGNYYSEYYILNKEKFAIRDKERYEKKKALKNQVRFDFEKMKIDDSELKDINIEIEV